MRAFIALGSNLGDRRKNIERAVEGLEVSHMVKVSKTSSLYETEPVGVPSQDKYLNAAAELMTMITPHTLLALLKHVEGEVGRTPSKEKWGPREIDLDILLYGDLVLDEPDLKIPHPLLHLRTFMLEPLNEIAPEVIHPVIKKSIAEILFELKSKLNQ